MAYYNGFGADDYEFGDESRKKKRNMVLLVAALAAIGIYMWTGRAVAQPKALPADPNNPPAPPPEAPNTTLYTVVAGDSLSLIAAKTYGDGTAKRRGNPGWKWWPYLWEINKSVVGCNWNALRVGMVLALPVPESLPQDRMAEIHGRAFDWKNPPATC
jgi:hypothetical protein